MRLVIIITGLASGGAEGMLVRLLTNLRERYDLEIRIFTLKNINFFKNDLENIGIKVTCINHGFNINTIAEIYYLSKYIIAYKPVVNTWLYHADLFGGILAKLCGARKIVWSIRQSNLLLAYNGIIKTLLIRLCSLLSGAVPNAIISCSRNANKAHVAIGYDKSKIIMIPNGFNVKHFNRYVNYPKLQNLSIIHVGRYDIQKNQIGFLKLAKLIKAKYPLVDFCCVGYKVDRKNFELNKLIHELDLNGSVKLLGERRDIHDLIAKSYCLISTSLGEGFPNVIAEAMLVGTPVIATNVGDTLDIMGSDEFVVESFNVKDIARKFDLLMSKSNNELSNIINGNRNRIKELYDINIIADKYLQSLI